MSGWRLFDPEFGAAHPTLSSLGHGTRERAARSRGRFLGGLCGMGTVPVGSSRASNRAPLPGVSGTLSPIQRDPVVPPKGTLSETNGTQLRLRGRPDPQCQ